MNALDTVGDRDFALDWCWGAARILLALSRVATDVIDFASTEFGLVTLDGSIAAGSSMMPQKKNPDVFELVRGQASRGVANVTQLMTLMKGLPTGYNRDLQEDRRAVLETGPLVRGAVNAVRLAIPKITFDAGRGAGALADGLTQATDLAEAIVRKGVPFRDAYKAVGALIKKANDDGAWLSGIDAETAKKIDARIDESLLAVLDPAEAVEAKDLVGGTGLRPVTQHLQAMRERLDQLIGLAGQVPSLSALAERVSGEPLAEKK
jgi:argininosuccinate lyase